MRKRFTAIMLAAVMALTLLPVTAINAMGAAVGFIPVTGIKDINTVAILDRQNLLGGTVNPTNATNNAVSYSKAADNALRCELTTDGRFTPYDKGVAKLIATVINGKGQGVDFAQEVNIRVVDPPDFGGGNIIHANGNALIIKEGKMKGLSTIYIDIDADGVLDDDEPSLAQANLRNAPKDNSSLSGYTVYGGSAGVTITGDTKITMLSGKIGYIFGGGRGGATIGDTYVHISGGTVNGNVIGGGEQERVIGNANVSISGGIVGNDVRGVNNHASATVTGTATVSVSGNPVIGEINKTDPIKTTGILLDTITNSKVIISGALTGADGSIVLLPNATAAGMVVAAATTKSHADAAKFTLADMPKDCWLAADSSAGTVYIRTDGYAIAYGANGGTGKMPYGFATARAPFTLPACGFTPPADKKFKHWAIGGVSGTEVAAGGTYTFTADTTVYAIWEDVTPDNPIIYSILSGAGGVFTKGSLNGLGFRVSGDYGKFLNVAVGGSIIVSSNFTKEPGSTVVTLKPAYLETLAVGIHTLRINFTDGYAETTFSVNAALKPPKTGDDSAPLVWLALLLICGVGSLALMGRKRRKA